MVIVDKPLEELLFEIDYQEWIKYDILSSETTPEQFIDVVSVQQKFLVERFNFTTLPPEKLPKGIAVRNNWQDVFSVVSYRTISREYCKSIEDLMGFRANESIVWELYSNAFMWGSGCDVALPISLKVFKGLNGYVLRMRDSGKGFDYHKLISRQRRKEKYFQKGGIGFRNLSASKEVSASYEGNGTIVNVQKLVVC